MTYLDFDNPKYEKGFKPFIITNESIKDNAGKRICYVRHCDLNPRRGYVFVRYARIHSKRAQQLLIDGGNDTINIREIVEIGIEI